MTNAFIACAGQSKLCKKLGYPKCLSDLGEETMIERQIRLLKECGVNDITLMVGSQQKLIREKVGWKRTRIRKYKTNIKFIPVIWCNKRGHLGEFYSWWQGRDKWRDTILLLGDLVYSKKSLQEMLNPKLDAELKKFYQEYGLILILTQKSTKWTNAEPFGIRMSNKGANFLRSLNRPLRYTMNPNEPLRLELMSVMGLFWHFQWREEKRSGRIYCPYFTPSDWIQDVDWFEGLEAARKRAKRFE